MRLAELQAAGRHPQLPLRVTLADGAGAAELRLDSLLRVLPGQRYVGAGEWRGRKVLAKLLVGGKAARHFQRELEGARLLAAQGLTTPALLADGLQQSCALTEQQVSRAADVSETGQRLNSSVQGVIRDVQESAAQRVKVVAEVADGLHLQQRVLQRMQQSMAGEAMPAVHAQRRAAPKIPSPMRST